MKFRKTALIEATQYHIDGPTPAGVCLGECCNREAVAHIHTLEGDLTVSDGDWVATGVKGEHWAIKPDVFAASYEPAEAALPPSSPVADSPTWLPIESAPMRIHDRVLLWWTTRGACSGYFDVDGDRNRSGWRGDQDLVIPRDQHRCTHWMPLPSAPSPSAGANKDK